MSPEFNQLLTQILQATHSKGMSEAEVANRLGIHPTTLSRIKKRGNCDFSLIQDMARLAGYQFSLIPDNNLAKAIQNGDLF
ncbi:MAG: helix-turn-helix transcriptional regulator [Methylococcales bacterium]|jgi:IS30 family transposase|nr:helix-turn-helix transcriptional regulator [Methylococcales bacterium]MBT7409400.1 helix-turn-helix transcriptional regulator [Methylococcales bacterium]